MNEKTRPRAVAFESGPLEVAGPARIVSATGEELGRATAEKPVYLCRCGASENKPFCDGAHQACDYAAAGDFPEEKLKEPTDDSQSEITVRVLQNGPLVLEGAFDVSCGGDDLRSTSRITVCRCGASSRPPVCDGSHKAAGFCAD